MNNGPLWEITTVLQIAIVAHVRKGQEPTAAFCLFPDE